MLRKPLTKLQPASVADTPAKSQLTMFFSVLHVLHLLDNDINKSFPIGCFPPAIVTYSAIIDFYFWWNKPFFFLERSQAICPCHSCFRFHSFLIEFPCALCLVFRLKEWSLCTVNCRENTVDVFKLPFLMKSSVNCAKRAAFQNHNDESGTLRMGRMDFMNVSRKFF